MTDDSFFLEGFMYGGEFKKLSPYNFYVIYIYIYKYI